MNSIDRAFNRGFYCAYAIMLRQHDQPTMVKSCIIENKMSVAYAISCGVDNYDLETLTPILEELEKERRDDETVNGLTI